MNRKKKPKWRYYHPHWFRLFKWIGRSLLILFTLLILVGLGATFYVRTVVSTTPAVTEEALRSDPSSNMYAANGELIWSSARNRRVYVEREELPEEYIEMLLATEQKTFYDDYGFSPTGLANAFISVAKKAMGTGEIRGGSSIEQQLIKLTVFSTSEDDRTVDRKIQEFYLANQLYQNYTKDEILEFYVNKLPLSENSFGAQTLAKTYYDLPLSELSHAKIALIVGTGQAPSAYNVYSNPNDAKSRRDDILYITRNDGFLTEEEYQAALAEPIDDGLMPRHWQNEETEKTVIQHDGYVQETLKQVEEMGYDIVKTPLQIHTALDVELNNYLKNLYDNESKYFQDSAQQSAATVIENSTGKVLAQIGGRGINEVSSYNRATQRLRSTGSSTKPFFYAAGIEQKGWATNKLFDGSRYNYAGTNMWANNYGGQVVGQATMQDALRYSYNTTILRAYDQIGYDGIATTLEDFGFQVPDDLTSGKALGFEASTVDVANAFSILSNGGVKRTPQYVNKIVFADDSEKVVEQIGEQTISENTAWVLLHMLQGTSYLNPDSNSDVYVEGLPQAVKTGTVGYPDNVWTPSGTAHDLWTGGTTPSISLAIWHGYDKPMSGENWLSESAMSQRKFDLHRDIAKRASQGYDNPFWPKPDGVTLLSGSGVSAHYKPNNEPRSYFTTTVKELDNDSNKFYGSDEHPEITRGDADYEEIDNNYEFKAWEEDIAKREEEVAIEIERLLEEQLQLQETWSVDRQPLDATIETEQQRVNELRDAYNERVRQLER